MMVAPIMLKRALHLLALLLLLWTLGLSGTGYAQTRALAEPAADAARVPPPDEEPYNGGYFADQSVPTTMTAGAVYTVTVRMVNNGTTTWSASTSHALGSQNPQDNGTWGGGRVGLSGNVLPGRIATFTFQVTAPANPGSYNFQWKMVQDGVEWFGGPSDNLVINVVAPPRVNSAQFSSQSVPNSMTAGQAYTVTVAMLNTGNTTWNAHGDIGLASANPLANNTWNVVRIDLPTTTAPGQTASSTFQIVAPNTPGTYNFQWNMVQDGIEWFGTPSSNVAVAVSAPAPHNASQIIGMTVPTLTAGQVANISVTLQNTGNTTWPAGSNYKLGSKNPDENMIWGVQRVDLASNVAPGQQYTFTFPITAPASGTYTMQWQMMQRYVEWFGGLASTSVTVGAPAGDTVTYIHTDALGSPVARSGSAGNVISRTSYEPYGRTASGVTPTIGFTGHVNDADTGLVYMQQRYYDPVAGRFLSVDPVTTDANSGSSFNRYAYANNSPYKYVDPDGRDPLSDCGQCNRVYRPGQETIGDKVMELIGSDPVQKVLQATAGPEMAALSALGGSMKIISSVSKVETVLEDSAIVVRGGTNTAERFSVGVASGAKPGPNGTVSGISVNSANGKSVQELAKGIPNGQIGTTTVGDVRKAGGNVIPSGTVKNPNHCDMCGITPKQAEKLFTPTEPNPSK